MKANVITKITIQAPSAQVFRYLSDLKYHHLWNPQVLRISQHGKLKLGSSFKSVSLLLGIEVESSNVVTKFAPPKELEIRNSVGMVQYTAHFWLFPAGQKTLVVLTTEVSSHSNAFAFAPPLLKILARRELQADMQALKIAVENNLQ